MGGKNKFNINKKKLVTEVLEQCKLEVDPNYYDTSSYEVVNWFLKELKFEIDAENYRKKILEDIFLLGQARKKDKFTLNEEQKIIYKIKIENGYILLSLYISWLVLKFK